jgi:guanine deaminase
MKQEVPIEEKFMRQAILFARRGVRSGQTPFGACIVKDGKVVAAAHNRVWRDQDITAHAEMVAIRLACRKLRTIDLVGCVIYSTCEPCPMCFSACHWARLDTIVYGAAIEDAWRAGFNELAISAQQMRRQGHTKVKVVGDFLRDEAKELFDLWSRRRDKRAY